MPRVYFRRRKGDKAARKEAPLHGTWHLDYRDAGGTRVQPRTDARTKAEAEVKLREALDEADAIRHGRIPAARKVMRVDQAAAEMLASRQGLDSYKSDEIYVRRHIIPALGKKYLAQVTVADVETFANGLLGGVGGNRRLAPGTVGQVLIRLSLIYKWAKKARVFMGESPVREAAKPKPPKRHPKKLRPQEMDLVLDHSGRWANLFWFAACTGLREGEIPPLLWSDLDLGHDAPSVHVKRSGVKLTPKGKRERIVPLPQPVAAMLRKRRRETTSVFVWPGPSGMQQRRPDAIYNAAFRAALTRAGLSPGWRLTCVKCAKTKHAPWPKSKPCHCGGRMNARVEPGDYTFRHLRNSYATALGNPALAQRALGHAELATTMKHYYAVDAEQVRDAAENIPFARARDADVTPTQVRGRGKLSFGSNFKEMKR
ncbi:tyrosine-type recombinase/integrase [Myxococcus landrumensis]|uniref:Tyr recombinase domain-containing protein n=1 Tax=Myxococcus landrumensis TaxID=2813577 RepID=A0ABX7N5I8_9BACT|nr:hypothetical protein [Myxococcus landrumus]QSQ14009.1 hypothetical protein JY572_37800 [Myxococcus landrumus]